MKLKVECIKLDDSRAYAIVANGKPIAFASTKEKSEKIISWIPTILQEICNEIDREKR